MTLEWHYLNLPREELFKKIEKRLKDRLRSGLVDEVKELHQAGVSWKRMEELGLEYRFVSRFLCSKPTYVIPGKSVGDGRDPESMSLNVGSRIPTSLKLRRVSKSGVIQNFLSSPYYTELLTEIKHYAKRQQTWFKK